MSAEVASPRLRAPWIGFTMVKIRSAGRGYRIHLGGTVHLLTTQQNELWQVIDDSSFERADIQLTEWDSTPLLRWRQSPNDNYLRIKGGAAPYEIVMIPGVLAKYETHRADRWAVVLTLLKQWLENLRREINAAERSAGETTKPPEWFIGELPAQYHDAVRRIGELQEIERRLRRMGGLLWETGDPLNRLVLDAFRVFGLPAENTKQGTTYDVTVVLPEGTLLIEVTGIDDQITKKSKKITQVLQATQQLETSEGYRVCIAVNAWRTLAPAERQGRELVSADALAILKRLDAVVFSTADLYDLWKRSLDSGETDTGRRVLEGLFRAPSGVVRLGLAQTLDG